MSASRCLCVPCIALSLLGGCSSIPKVNISDARFDSTTPYPEFVPLEILLKEPEATIDDSFEASITIRAADQQDEALAAASQSATDTGAVDSRLETLRAKRDALTDVSSALDEESRTRLEAGISVPE